MVHIPYDPEDVKKPWWVTSLALNSHFNYKRLCDLNLLLCLIFLFIIVPAAFISPGYAGVAIFLATTYLIQSWIFLKIWRGGSPAFGMIPFKDKKEPTLEDYYGTKISNDEWESIIEEGSSSR